MLSTPKPVRRITVYTTDFCVWCRRAKQLLTARGLDYREVNLARDEAERAALAARTGRMTFPQIVIDCEPVGGFEDLAVALAHMPTAPVGRECDDDDQPG